MAHILRKDLKRDEIRETFTHGVDSVASHKRLVWIIGGIVVVVAIAIFGWNSYSRRQTASAAAVLDEGMKIFQARIRTPGESADPAEITYVDEKNKYSDAERKFLTVADAYGRTMPGRLARYYAALCEIQLAKYDDAQRNLERVQSESDENVAGLARFQLAAVYGKTGKGEQAIQLYRQLADKPTAFVPKPLVLLTLADHYRKSNPAEATKLYDQIKKDFPNSPAAEQAEQGLEMLNMKS